MATMVTDQIGRLSAYTIQELSAYRINQLGSLPYGINQAFTAAQAAAASRERRIRAANASAEKVDSVAYSALGTAIDKLSTAANKFLQSLS